ncbi:MAG: hypothetical protein LBD38_04375 [Streptococcaceae bacterium]|jgi:uncharacterized FAD-dependent dehydrogenase|nr:hypothetical protein [Streptococcaceae bacterium]
MLRISQIKLSIDEPTEQLLGLVCKKLQIKESEVKAFRIYKESIDARKSNMIYFIYTVDVSVEMEDKILDKGLKNVSKTPELAYTHVKKGSQPLKHRPVVIGFGPAGMFAALILAQNGYAPIVFERGEQVEARVASIEAFWSKGILNPKSNVQFGEGGAGTFSDGKLTSRVRDLRGRKVLEELVQAGAPEDILYKAHPHVGTDLLRGIVKNIRKEILRLGGDIYFDTQVTGFRIEDGKLKGLTLDTMGEISCEQAILAIGHSARDTFLELFQSGVSLSQKPFSVGLRVEHPQTLVNQAQYKKFAESARLGSAEYRLTHQAKNGRGVYTFCMCPGGLVVPSASEDGMLVTNGMSEHARDQENANSALLVQVFPEDFEGNHPLEGIEFQRKLEQKAFELGGGSYKAPAQLIKDYLEHRPSTQLGKEKPSYALVVHLTE